MVVAKRHVEFASETNSFLKILVAANAFVNDLETLGCLALVGFIVPSLLRAMACSKIEFAF